MEKELLERAMPQTEPGRSVTRHDELDAIFGCNIVVTLCVYYPCQDAGAQRPRLCRKNFSLQRVPSDFEALYRSLRRGKV